MEYKSIFYNNICRIKNTGVNYSVNVLHNINIVVLWSVYMDLINQVKYNNAKCKKIHHFDVSQITKEQLT